MTDTNDLRRMLDELADETPELPTKEWIAGTQHKVRVRRRARVAGAVGAVALVLAAAAAIVPQVVDTAAPEPVAPSPPPDGTPGWPLPDVADTKRIIAARMNDEGTSELRWTTRVSGERVELGGHRFYSWPVASQFCYLGDDLAAAESPIRLVSSIDGQDVASTACRHSAEYPPVNWRMVQPWASPPLKRFGIERGEMFTVTMWLERDGERLELSDAEFGFLLYWECESERGPQVGGPGVRPGSAEACGSVF
jgi:hypothetical protein